MGPDTGRIAFRLRRVAGAVLSVYVVVWAIALVGDPGRPFLADLRALGLAGRALELALIGVVAWHALDGMAQIAIARRRDARNHRRWFVGVALGALLLVLLHGPIVLGGP